MKQPEREAAFRKTMNFCRSRITLGRSFPLLEERPLHIGDNAVVIGVKTE